MFVRLQAPISLPLPLITVCLTRPHHPCSSSPCQVVTPDPSQRVASEGVEVMAGAPIVLVHPSTQQALNLDTASRQRVPNDFGFEFEVSGYSAVSAAMQGGCEYGKIGMYTKTLPKAASSPNYWCFMTGSKVATLPAPRTGLPDVTHVLPVILKQLQHVTGGLPGLEKKVVPLQSEEGYMLVDEFLMVLKQLNINALPQQLEAMIEAFPAVKAKHVNTRALLLALRAAE